jgi:hypothetical protein
MKIPDRFPERFSPLGFTISLIVFIGAVIWEVKHKYAGRDIETIGDAITAASLLFCFGMTGYVERFVKRYRKE